MRKPLVLALSIAAMLVAVPDMALAQKASSKPAATAKKPKAKAAATSTKTSAKKPAATAKKTAATKKPATAASGSTSRKAAAMQVLRVNPITGANAPADFSDSEAFFPAQAPEVMTGMAQCDSGVSVTVTQVDGIDQFAYLVRTNRGHRYSMRQVGTTTGATRLEDKASGIVWLQLPNKSMLMNQTRGERIATECRTPEQRANEEALESAPPAAILLN